MREHLKAYGDATCFLVFLFQAFICVNRVGMQRGIDGYTLHL